MLLISLLFAAALAKEPQDVVARLYQKYPPDAKKVVIEESDAVLRQYFDDELASLIRKDRECEARTHEICALDFDVIWDSQDPAGSHGLTVAPPDASHVVRVTFLTSDGAKLALDYRMVQTSRGWRIADIGYPEGPSLEAMLRGK